MQCFPHTLFYLIALPYEKGIIITQELRFREVKTFASGCTDVKI